MSILPSQPEPVGSPRPDAEQTGVPTGLPVRMPPSRWRTGGWIFLCLGASILLHLLVISLSSSMASWVYYNPVLHAVMETVGSSIGVVVGGLILINRRLGRGTTFSLPLAYGLMAMSVLDGLHSILPSGDAFVWLHSIGAFAGGALYAMVWYKPQESRHLKTICFSMAAIVVAMGVLGFLLPNAVPRMLNQGMLSPIAIWLNIAGGVLILLAAFRLWGAFRRYRQRDDLLFMVHCLLLGAANLLMEQTTLWESSWWCCHVLRLAAYGVAMGFAVDSMLSLQNEVMRHRLELQQAVIDAQRRAFEAIDEKQSWRKIVDLYMLISVTDRSGKIVDVNEGFCALSQYTRAELLGKNHRIINSGHHPKEFWIDMWRTIASGKTWRGEVCNRAKDGSLYWVDAMMLPLTNPAGKITGFVSLRFDITERVKAQAEVDKARKQLVEQQDRFERAIRGTSDGLWDLYPETKVVWYSDQFKRLLGLKPEKFDCLEPNLQGFVQRVHPDDVDEGMAALERHLKMGERFDIQVRVKKESGEYGWFRTRGLATRDKQGRPIRMAGSLTEIDDQKRAEEELRKTVAELKIERAKAEKLAEEANMANRQKSEFLANMSHEIRTPMTAILGYTDLLLGEDGLDKAPSQRRMAFESIRRNGNHLLSIINDILDMSKIEAGKMVLERIQAEPRQLVNDVVTALEERASSKGLEFKLHFNSVLPPTILTDPTRLRQILINLVGNAIKFTEAGSVALDVSYDALAQVIEFVVVDTGIGMDKDQLQLIAEFNSFTQASAGMTRKFGGTGLGLSISHALANLLGGTLDVTSEFGVGSAFTVRLPVGKADRLPKGPWKSLEAGIQVARPKELIDVADQENPLAGIHILVAEDGADNQKLIRHFLEKAGGQVSLVENGQKAIDEAMAALQEDRPYDVVLMDMQMPVMDGYAATQHLRKLGFAYPIIALTAHAMAGDRESCLSAGCSDFATKPLQRKQLINQIYTAVDAFKKEAVDESVEDP